MFLQFKKKVGLTRITPTQGSSHIKIPISTTLVRIEILACY